MANKTIHELTPASTVDSNYEIAVYDIDGNGTKKATADQILKTSSLLYAYDDDEPTGEVDFTSQDTTLTPSSSTSVDLLSGNDSWSQRFVKISQMFKNVRFLLSKLGTTDISSIGNGTVTSALDTLNDKTTVVSFGTNVTVSETANYKSFQKIGNTVIFSFQGENKARSEGQLIFTIPSGYRPITNYYLVGILGTVPCVFQLKTDGTCIIYTAASYPTARAYLNASYTCN